MFQVISVETGDPVMLEDGSVPATWPDGASAAIAARSISRKVGTKHRTQRVIEIYDWRAREMARFDSGEYMPLSWAGESWWLGNKDRHEVHFSHVSKNNPKLIAFTESEERGLEDKQSVMKPGAYLKKFFGHVLCNINISNLSAKHGALYGDDTKMIITRNPDEIEKIYRNGPSSCMAKATSDFSSPFHPVRLYGEPGDLGLAYLLNNGSITARTVVWPEKKVYVRIYGDATRLVSFLSAEGYNKGSIEGAKIPRHEFKPDRFVVPFLDSVGAADVEDDFLVLTPCGELSCGSTEGTATRAPLMKCECCEAQVRIAHSKVKRITTDGLGHRTQLWCNPCVAAGTYVCSGSGYHTLNSIERITFRGHIYSLPYAKQYLRKCAKTDKWFDKSETYEVTVGYHKNGHQIIETWCGAEVTKHGFRDYIKGRYFANELKSKEDDNLCVKSWEVLQKRKKAESRTEPTVVLHPTSILQSRWEPLYSTSTYQYREVTFDHTSGTYRWNR